MIDGVSKLPAHLRPPYEKPRKLAPAHRDATGETAVGNADRDRKKPKKVSWGVDWK